MHTIISADGTSIAYDRTGTGPPLVLVGGAFSYRRYPGQVKLAELLAAQFTVYNYDRRGRGDSGDTAPYASGREIDDLAAVITAAGGHAHVWGLSSGAVLALDAAAAAIRGSELVARRGLGHTKKLNTKVIAATLTEFLTGRLPSATHTTNHDTVPRA